MRVGAHVHHGRSLCVRAIGAVRPFVTIESEETNDRLDANGGIDLAADRAMEARASSFGGVFIGT
jgi:hypothetical protein